MQDSHLFNVTWKDAFHSVVTSFATALFTSIALIVNNKLTAQIYIFTLADCKLILAITLLTFLGNLSKRFLTDQNGDVIGMRRK